MNWDAIAAISETIGAIAVVVTLIYLAIQIRQNTKSIRGSTLQANTAVWSAMFCSMANEDIAIAYALGSAGKAEIKTVQYTQFFLVCRAMFVSFENQYYQYRQGLLDESTYQGYQRSISAQLLAFPGFRIWWQQNRDVFSQEFVAYVDELVEETPVADAGKLIIEWRRLAEEQLKQN